jgi:hypothetical protein
LKTIEILLGSSPKIAVSLLALPFSLLTYRKITN